MDINKDFLFQEFFKKRSKRDIDFVVIHHTSVAKIEDAIALYKKYEVSAHYLIDELGKIYCLVEDNNIAYHAGVSYWAGVDSLNATSIGIELVCEDPFWDGYLKLMMNSLIKLCAAFKDKYNIKNNNIVGHSDIAYFRKSGFLNRKQDPSNKFDWQMMFDNDLALNPNYFDEFIDDIARFEFGKSDKRLGQFKKKLHEFGYKVENLNDDFDNEMKALMEVFKRRFIR